jgi:hypothetical protein
VNALLVLSLLGAAPTLTTYTLPDGLDVVVVEHPNFTSCAVRLVVRAGAAEDFPGKRGLAHIVEHTVLGGPEGLRQLTSRTASINAATSMSSTTFTLEAPRETCEDELRRYLLLVTDGKLRKPWFTLEKEIIAREELYFGRGGALIEQTLFGNTPELILGTQTTRDAVEHGDARLFFQRFYTPDRMTLVVTGLDAEAVKRALDGGFKLMPSPLISDEAHEAPQKMPSGLMTTNTRSTLALVAELPVSALPSCRLAGATLEHRLMQTPGAEVSVDCMYAYKRLLLVVIVFGQLGNPTVSEKTVLLWRDLKPLARSESRAVEQHFGARELPFDAPELADRIGSMAVWLSGKELFDAVPGWWTTPSVKLDLAPIRRATDPKVSAILISED